MKATFGREVDSVEDELFILADETAQVVSQEDTTGAALVDLLPICERSIAASESEATISIFLFSCSTIPTE